MKVLFLIATSQTGLGGHSWSLRSIVEALRSHVECRIVNLGVAPAGALADLPVPCHDILSQSRGLVSPLRHLNHLVRSTNPDILHAFDERSLFFARLVAWRHSKAIVHTKCGGPNPIGFHPRVDNLVLFSVENERYFSGNPRFRRTRLHLIPNRINEVPQDSTLIARARDGIGAQDVVFLRIARFGLLHKASSQQTLALVKRLRQDGVPARFVQIGVVNSDATLQGVRACLEREDRVLIEPEFTRRASALIEAGDFVVGTGRSFMEAAARGRVLLCPLQNEPLPAIVTRENFNELFATNFSARSRIKGFDGEANYAAIRETVNSPDRRREAQAFSRRMFDEHFSLQAVVPKYMALYRDLKPATKLDVTDLLRHVVRVVWRR